MNIFISFFTVGISTIINILLSLLTTPIITRIVSPDVYGVFNVFTSRVGIVASLLYFGLNDSLYRFFFTCKNNNEKRSLLKLCFLIPLSASIVVSVISIILFNLQILKIDYSLIIFCLLCISVIFSVWNTLSMEMLQNTKQSKKYSIATLIQKIVYCALSILLLFVIKNKGLFVLTLATALSTFASALFGTIITKEYWNFKDVSFPENTKEIALYSAPIYVYFAIYSIYDVLDKLLVDYYCNEYEVGIYSSAFAIVGIFAVIQIAFNVVWRPIQTEQYTNNPDDKELIKKGNRYMTIIMFFIGINIILFKDILCLFLGEAYREGSCLIPFLIFNPIMNTLIVTSISGIEYSKKSYIRAFIITISLITELLLCKLLIVGYGVIGIAMSMSISLVIQYLLTVMFSNMYYPIEYGISKTFIIIVITFVYAYVDSMFNNVIANIAMYVVVVIVIYNIYKQDIKGMFVFFKESLFNKKEQ